MQKKEFNYYGKDLSEKEVTSKCILSSMNLGEGFEDENDFLTDYDEYENTDLDDDDLNIELDDNEVSRNESTEYNVEKLVGQFLTDYDNM
nr:4411_t:CDS:2 [Entrophospora candida]